MELNVKISKKVATYTAGDELPICGNTGIFVKFALDDEWDAHDKKTARFIWGGKHEDVEFTGDTCEAPVVSNTQAVLVGLYAGELPEDGFMLSSTLCTIAYGLSVRCGNSTPSAGTGKNYTNEARGYAAAAEAAAQRAEVATDFTVKNETLLLS